MLKVTQLGELSLLSPPKQDPSGKRSTLPIPSPQRAKYRFIHCDGFYGFKEITLDYLKMGRLHIGKAAKGTLQNHPVQEVGHMPNKATYIL